MMDVKVLKDKNSRWFHLENIVLDETASSTKDKDEEGDQ